MPNASWSIRISEWRIPPNFESRFSPIGCVTDVQEATCVVRRYRSCEFLVYPGQIATVDEIALPFPKRFDFVGT
jgi:hypothetical protein